MCNFDERQKLIVLMTLVLELLLRQLIVEMSLLVSPRGSSILSGRSREKAAGHVREQHTAAIYLTQGALQCWAVRAYMGPLWAHTHTLGDPKPPDQGHTVTPCKHRYKTHAYTKKPTHRQTKNHT